MRTRYKIMIGFVLVMIVSAGLLSFWWQAQKQMLYEMTIMTSYPYTVSISTDQILNNVTLYVPIPILNNTSSVGQDIIDHNFNGDGPSWKYAIVETEHGPMLSMKTEKMTRPPILNTTYLSTIVFSNLTVDTMNPVNNSMVLMPKYNLTYVGSGDKIYEKHTKIYNYDSQIYVHYETLPDAEVRVSVSMDALNEWWIGGWQSNSYREYMEIQLLGPQDGWKTLKGELVTGEGTYLEME